MNVVWLAYRLSVLSAISLISGCYAPGRGLQSPWAALEDSLVFKPARFPEGNWDAHQLQVEDVWFAADDGTQLHGWYLRHDEPMAIVLYAHGNTGNISHRASVIRDLHEDHRLSIMIFDYRGFGRSEGKPNEEGILQDARAARNWLAEREGITPEEIVIMGRSLGGGVAVDLAAEDGARGLILVSTFTSLPDVGARSVPLLPVRSLMRYRLDSRSKIAKYHGPLLQCHGDADRVVPYEIGQELHAAANPPKQFISIPGGRHNDALPNAFRDELDDFLANLP